MYILVFLFFKQKTAYEMRISDWSSDVCSSDLLLFTAVGAPLLAFILNAALLGRDLEAMVRARHPDRPPLGRGARWSLGDRKSVVKGKRVSVRVDLGGRRSIK